MDNNINNLNNSNSANEESPYSKMRPEAVQFTDKLMHYTNEYFINLAKFKQNYVFYHKNPEYEEYQKNFVDSKGQLQSINKGIFLLANGVQSKIERLNAYITDINRKLMDDKVYYAKLTAVYNSMENTGNGATTMIHDYKKMYNQEYLYSFNLFVGIIIASGVIFSVFKGSKLKDGVSKTASKVTDLIKSKIPANRH
jgi:hypothetical protein